MLNDEDISALSIVCASCRELVERDGWVEWLESEAGHLHGFRIVHRSEHCTYRTWLAESVRDHHLSYFVGARGMRRLAWRVEDAKGVEASSLGALMELLALSAELGLMATPSMPEGDAGYEARYARRQRGAA